MISFYNLRKWRKNPLWGPMERWMGLTPAEKPPIDREIELNLFEREKKHD